MRMKWSVGKQILLGKLVSIFVLLVLCVIAGITAHDLRASFLSRNQARLQRETVNDFLRLMQDLETGQRGFLLTNDESYLQPFNEETG
jgi:methyl-accepting chemotaxis protein